MDVTDVLTRVLKIVDVFHPVFRDLPFPGIATPDWSSSPTLGDFSQSTKLSIWSIAWWSLNMRWHATGTAGPWPGWMHVTKLRRVAAPLRWGESIQPEM
jgi:hypothetical protein